MRGKRWTENNERTERKKKALTRISRRELTTFTWRFELKAILPSFVRAELRATREIFLNTSEHGRLINSRSCIHPSSTTKYPKYFFLQVYESGCNLYVALQNFTLWRDTRTPDLNRPRLIFRITSIHIFIFFIFTSAFPLCYVVENSGFNPRRILSRHSRRKRTYNFLIPRIIE